MVDMAMFFFPNIARGALFLLVISLTGCGSLADTAAPVQHDEVFLDGNGRVVFNIAQLAKTADRNVAGLVGIKDLSVLRDVGCDVRAREVVWEASNGAIMNEKILPLKNVSTIVYGESGPGLYYTRAKPLAIGGSYYVSARIERGLSFIAHFTLTKGEGGKKQVEFKGYRDEWMQRCFLAHG